jgi:hypothetical protein
MDGLGMTRMEPVRMRFLIDHSSAPTIGANADKVYYIDFARELSKMTRSLNRQFRDYTIVGGLVKDGNNESVVRFNTAPRAWYTKTALRRGKELWDRMNTMRMKEGSLGLVKPKYHDYKVLLDQTMRDSPRVLQCVDASGAAIPGGEWVYSTYVSEDVDWSNLGSGQNRNADDFQAFVVGNHFTDTANGGSGNGWAYVGLLKSWVDSRAKPVPTSTIAANEEHTSTLVQDPLVNLFDEADADDEVIQNLLAHNDETPYDPDEMMGLQSPSGSNGQLLQRMAMAAVQNGAGQIAAIPGFKALCGLVQVHITQPSGNTGQLELLLDVMPKGEAF